MKHGGVLAWALLFVSACAPPVQSVYPLYHGEDAVFLPGLLGSWITEDGSGIIEWLPGKNKGYIVRGHGIGEEQADAVPDLSVHVLRLDGHYLADVYTEQFPEVIDSDSSTKPFWTPTHLFFLLALDGSELRISMLSPGFAASYLQEHPCAVRHILREPRLRFSHGKDPSEKPEYDIPVLLTDTPKHLQRFIKRIARNPRAFEVDNPLLVLKRLPESERSGRYVE